MTDTLRAALVAIAAAIATLDDYDVRELEDTVQETLRDYQANLSSLNQARAIVRYLAAPDVAREGKTE